MTKRKMQVGAALNGLTVVLELIGLISCAADSGSTMLQYYTQDSNILALIACSLMLIYQLRSLKTGKEIPHWVGKCLYAAVCLTSVTFLVVIFVLSPMFAAVGGLRYMMFSGSMLYLHTLCPILAFVSLLWFSGEKLEIRDTLLAMIPTLLYAAVTITLNLLRRMEGPYPFLMVYQQSTVKSLLWAVVILGGAYGIAWAIWKLTCRVQKKAL